MARQRCSINRFKTNAAASATSANIAGPAANTTHYFQLQVGNSASTINGTIYSFTTSAAVGSGDPGEFKQMAAELAYQNLINVL